MRSTHPALLLWASALVLVLAPPGRADEIHLKDGTVVSGKVALEDDHYYAVVNRHRKYLIKKEDVKERVRKKSFMEEYEERLAALPVDDAEAVFEFARWLESRDWQERAYRAYQEVVRIDPDHREARLALGYRRFEGEWLSPDEVKRRQGLVEFHGQWYTKHELAELKKQLAKDDELRQAYEESRRLHGEILGILPGFATFDPKQRRATHGKLYAMANRLDSPELRQFADDALAYYDARADYLCAQMKARTEVQAVWVNLTMPIASFETLLGGIVSARPVFVAQPAQNPVVIQLPELHIVESSSTVDIPAGCG